MPRNNGFIDLCAILDIPCKPYLNDPVLFDELYMILLNRNIEITKYIKGLFLSFNFTYNGETYFFKFAKPVNPFMELIYEEGCHDLGIPCIDYDIASIGDIRGNISKDFKRKDARYILGFDVLRNSKINVSSGDDDVVPPNINEEFDNDVKRDLAKFNSLESIWAALEINYKDRPDMPDVVQKLMNKLVNLFVVDLLFGNTDRNFNNWQIIEYDSGFVDLCPAFDNANSMLISPSWVSLSMFVNTRTGYYDTLALKDNVIAFVRQSSSEFSLLVENSLWVLENENALRIIDRIEKKIGVLMPEKDKNYYLDNFEKYLEEIKKFLVLGRKRVIKNEKD